jgi:hypothetical protein
MASREAVIAALTTLLGETSAFVTLARRNRAPESLTPSQCPAVFLEERKEDYIRPAPNLPPIRVMHIDLVIYNDVGNNENATPATAINNALDALDAAMLPDNAALGRLTLGGLVYSVLIDGEAPRASGAVTGKSYVVVPIQIRLP